VTPPNAPASLSRRRVIQGTAATGAAAIGLSGAGPGSLQLVDDAAALWGSEQTGYAEAAAYAVRSVGDFFTGDDTDDLDEYVGADALAEQSMMKAESIAASDERVTDIMNNRAQDSRNIAWMKGKSAAIEKINEGAEYSEVESAALEANDEYYSTVMENIVNHYIEVVAKLQAIADQEEAHDDVSEQEIIEYGQDADGTSDIFPVPFQTREVTVTLPNGTEMTFNEVWEGGNSYDEDWSTGITTPSKSNHPVVKVHGPDGNTATVLPVVNQDQENYAAIGHAYRNFEDQHSQMEDNLTTWATETYDAITAGEIDSEDLVDPMTMASEWSTDYEETGHYAYAASSLAILGIPTNFDNEMTVDLADGSTLTGMIFCTDDSQSFEVGTEYDPADLSGTAYLAYDATTATRSIDSSLYQSPMDGDRFYLASGEEPFADTLYQIEVASGTAVEAHGDEFSKDQDTGDWYAELAEVEPDQEIESVTTYADDSQDAGVIELTDPFTITEAKDTEGNDVSSVDVESKNYQTSDPGISEETIERWNEMMEDMDNYEPNQGGGGGDLIPDNFALFGLGSVASVGLVAGGALFAYLKLLKP